MPGRVAGALVDFERRLPQLQGVALGQPAVRLEAAGAGHAPVGSGRLDALDPEAVIGVGTFDGEAGLLTQLGRAAAVVEVPVSDPDTIQLQAAGPDQLDQLVDLSAGIDQRGLLRARAPHQRTVLLQRRDGRDQGADGRGGGRRSVHGIPVCWRGEPRRPFLE